MKVNKLDIHIVNRWKIVETANGDKLDRSMRQHYAQLELLIEPFLQYTSAI